MQLHYTEFGLRLAEIQAWADLSDEDAARVQVIRYGAQITVARYLNGNLDRFRRRAAIGERFLLVVHESANGPDNGYVTFELHREQGRGKPYPESFRMSRTKSSVTLLDAGGNEVWSYRPDDNMWYWTPPKSRGVPGRDLQAVLQGGGSVDLIRGGEATNQLVVPAKS